MAQKTSQEILNSVIKSLNINIRAFAREINQPYYKIYDICRGKSLAMSVPMANAISEKFGINESYLLSGEGEMYSSFMNRLPQADDDLTVSFLRVVSTLSNKNKELKLEVDHLKEIIRSHGLSHCIRTSEPEMMKIAL